METIEKTMERRLFGIYFNEKFIQGDVTIKILQQENGGQSRRDDFYFLIEEKEYFSIDDTFILPRFTICI